MLWYHFPKLFFLRLRNKTGDEPQNLRPFFTFNGCSWGARSLSLFRHLSIRVNRPVFPVAWARAYTTSWNRKIIWSLEYRAEKRYSGNGETKSKALRIGSVLFILHLSFPIKLKCIYSAPNIKRPLQNQNISNVTFLAKWQWLDLGHCRKYLYGLHNSPISTQPFLQSSNILLHIFIIKTSERLLSRPLWITFSTKTRIATTALRFNFYYLNT